MNCKKRWIDDLRRKFGLAHFARRWLEAAHVDSLACTASSRKAFLHIGEAGVGAEVYEVLSRPCGRTPRTRNGEDGQESEQGKIADIFHELFFLTIPPRKNRARQRNSTVAAQRLHGCSYPLRGIGQNRETLPVG